MKFLKENNQKAIEVIERIGSSGGKLEDKIAFLILKRKEYHDNNEVQNTINKVLDKLYDIKYNKDKKVVNESNQLKDMQIKHRRKQKGMSPFIKLDAGDVEHNIAAFNNAMGNSSEGMTEDFDPTLASEEDILNNLKSSGYTIETLDDVIRDEEEIGAIEKETLQDLKDIRAKGFNLDLYNERLARAWIFKDIDDMVLFFKKGGKLPMNSFWNTFTSEDIKVEEDFTLFKQPKQINIRKELNRLDSEEFRDLVGMYDALELNLTESDKKQIVALLAQNKEEEVDALLNQLWYKYSEGSNQNVINLGTFYKKDDLFEDIDEGIDLDTLANKIEYNGALHRGTEVPAPISYKINQKNIPDNMRLKYFETEVDDDTIYLTYLTQEEFSSDDSNEFINEIRRMGQALASKLNYTKPFTIALDVESREGREYGKLVYNVKINQDNKESDEERIQELENKAEEYYQQANQTRDDGNEEGYDYYKNYADELMREVDMIRTSKGDK